MRYNPLASEPTDLIHIRYSVAEDAWISIFSSDPLLIGSDGACDLRLDGQRIDGLHVEIFPEGDAWWVRDLDTSGGTYLNEESIDVARLSSPAILRLGDDGPRIQVALRR